jgi:transcriptional regulator with XRE-family HTH domain
MEKQVFGKLVQALRKEHRDEDGTLWTQQTLASKCGVDKRTIERIEQGVLRKFDPDMLLRLANALELTTIERKEFFFAALSLDSSNLASEWSDPEETLSTLLCLLESVKLPAMILDVYADVVAVNSAAIYLFDMYDDLVKYPFDAPAAYNMLRITFSRESKYRTVLNKQWARNARHNLHVFRGISLRYRFHAYFRQTLSELWKHSAFRQYWEQAHLEDEDSSMDSLIYAYRHPNFGPIRYMANFSHTVTKLGELYWVIYIPMDQRTTGVFQDMVHRYGSKVLQLAPWPKK